VSYSLAKTSLFLLDDKNIAIKKVVKTISSVCFIVVYFFCSMLIASFFAGY